MPTTTPTDRAPKRRATRPATAVFTNILCAVDGTRSSLAAVRAAAALAGPDGRLTLLTVTAQEGSGQTASAAISPSHAERILDYARRVAEKSGVAATTVIDPQGPPVPAILRRARAHDLLVIGAPKTSWLARLIAGDVAAATLRELTVPLLLVRPATGRSLRGGEILLASDGRAESSALVRLAGELAATQDAHLTLVHALVSESQAHPREIRAQAQELERSLPGRVTLRVTPGRAPEAILDAAHEVNASVVLLGSRRLRGPHALGSVSRRVMHDSPCSVLVLPPRRKARSR